MALVLKSPKERLTELVGSLLAGGLVAVATSIVAVLIGGLVADDSSQTADFQRYSEYGWLVLMSIAGTWAVLIPSKFWEGTRGEAVLRRFVMMVVGLGLGVLAFAVAGLFAVNLSVGPDFGIDPFVRQQQLSHDFYTAYGRPQILAFLACFGTLFLLVRWWRQADPLRSSRLSLWSVFVSVAAAGLVASLCAVPARGVADHARRGRVGLGPVGQPVGASARAGAAEEGLNGLEGIVRPGESFCPR